MQAKLPDINSAIVRHRTGSLVAMAQLNYSLAATELRAMNSLLPKDYKVIEDSKEYNQRIKSKDVLICNQCKKPVPFSEVVFYNKSVNMEIQLLYSIEKIKVWSCPECKFENPNDGTDREIQQYQKPFYAECMPEVPKVSLFGNKLGYKINFEKWFDIALNELENKIGLYRTDYAAQQLDDAAPFDDEDDNANSS